MQAIDNLQAIEALSNEQRKFPPSPKFVQSANTSDLSLYDEAARDHEGFGLVRHESCLIGQFHSHKCASGIFRIRNGLLTEN